MGLGAPKRRNKLSHDPNNTTWSKSTNTYGHKILSAQGWKTGDYLGAHNASHSDHYTAANASHIRILLREENLGLGAQLGASKADTFGLSLFSGVLGRLNGKTDAEVQKQQCALRDAELRTYQAQKFGSMSFVSGGFLVGDKIEKAIQQTTLDGWNGASPPTVDTKELKSKKRKAQDTASGAAIKRPKKGKKAVGEDLDKRRTDLRDAETAKPRKRQLIKREAKTNTKTCGEDDDSVAAKNISSRAHEPGSTLEGNNDDDQDADGDSKSRRKHRRSKVGDLDRSIEAAPVEDGTSRRRQDKRSHKEERRKRKEEDRRLRSKSPASVPSLSLKKDTLAVTKLATPAHTAVLSFGSRNAIRQRYIQQKRMASLDPQAMREIFMLKAAA